MKFVKIFMKVILIFVAIFICGKLLNKEIKRMLVQKEIKDIPPLVTECNLDMSSWMPNAHISRKALFVLRNVYNEYEGGLLNDFLEEYEIENIILNNNYIPKQDFQYHNNGENNNEVIDFRFYTFKHKSNKLNTVHLIVKKKETNELYLKTFEIYTGAVY